MADQQKFFRSLRDQVGALVKAKKSAQEVRDSIERINATLAGDAQIARYVGKGGGPGMARKIAAVAQVEKVYVEMTGQQLPAAKKIASSAREQHAMSHGLASLA